MPAPTKKSPSKLEALHRMHADGASAREIAEGLGLDQKTVRAWMGEMGLRPNGGCGPRVSRDRAPVSVDVRAAAQEAARVVVEAAGEPPSGEEAVEVLRRRLASLRASLDRLGPAVESDQYPAAQFKALGQYEIQLVAEIASLTPPAPTDPERDPANQEAAGTVRRRLERLVHVAEQAERCGHCGKPPWSAERQGVGR